jgi:transcription elongation factor GreA
MKVSYMTKEVYDKLMAELDEMKTKGREEIAQAIATARDKGDLSENAEYDAAKDAQGMHELKINELEKQLANVKFLKEEDVDLSQVGILTKVKLLNKKLNKEFTFKIVSESEADIKEKKISVSSPIGEGLLGKKVGEIAKIETPGGIMELEILEISI